MGQEKVYISCNYSCTIFFLVRIYWLNESTFIFSIFEFQSQKKQNSKQNVKVEKMVVLVKTFDHHKFQLVQLPCKIVKKFETEI